MEYVAGFFDAEGYISLVRAGNFVIGIEQTDEKIAHFLQENFRGNIYSKSRKNRKISYDWKITTNIPQAIHFLEKVRFFSVVKKNQLDLLYEYLQLRRTDRKNLRNDYIAKIAACKVPVTAMRETLDDVEPVYNPSESFYKWLAGFFDGDGCFSIYETKGRFQTWIGCHSIDPLTIIHIQKHITGSITSGKGAKHTIWKWICRQNEIPAFCDSLYPFLKIKKTQAALCKESKLVTDRNQIYHLISQIKSLNS